MLRPALLAAATVPGGAAGMWAGNIPSNVVAYKGCYQDKASSPMFGSMGADRMVGRGLMNALGPAGSIRNCADKCKRHGEDNRQGNAYKFFGYKDSIFEQCPPGQRGNCAPRAPECWCGDEIPAGYDLLNDDACPTSICYIKGDQNHGRPCGGSMTMAVYQREQLSSVAGDPFTTYNNKKVQFYLPVHLESKLITCGNFELHGRVMSSGIPGDSQQWFDMFRMRVGDKDAVTVEIRDTLPLLPTAGSMRESLRSAEYSGDDGSDITVPWKVEKRVQHALATMRRGSAQQAEQRALTTLNVTVEGAVLSTVSSLTAASGRVDVVVSQDTARAIGRGFVESVNVNAEDVGVRVESSMASKFTSELDRIRKMHMDMTFTHLNVTDCMGALPELWGIRQMSSLTAKYLVPVANDTAAQ